MNTEARSTYSRPGFSLFSIWREAGVLLLTISLFFLPWFRDNYPPAGRSPVITGVEFLTYGAWPIILAYAAAWLSYIVSKFSNWKWAGMIILLMTWFVYLYLHLIFTVIGFRHNPAGIPLERTHLEAEVRYPAMIGMWVNWLGLIFLAVGLYLAERGRGRTAVFFTGLGTLFGLFLLIGLILVEVSLPELFYNLNFLPHGIRTNDTLYELLTWVQIIGLPFGGAVLGAWLALKKSAGNTFNGVSALN